jgi:hypothetical protein
MRVVSIDSVAERVGITVGIRRASIVLPELVHIHSVSSDVVPILELQVPIDATLDPSPRLTLPLQFS